jgi:hypothetical protein
VLPSMTKGEIVGRLVVVIDVNPSHGFWTTRLIKVFGHEGQCTCIYNNHEWIVYIMLFLMALKYLLENRTTEQ